MVCVGGVEKGLILMQTKQMDGRGVLLGIALASGRRRTNDGVISLQGKVERGERDHSVMEREGLT